jgi:A/G-specific adenine glycosylase
MNECTGKLMNWYGEYKRPLPWRNTTDPYKVWLSEIILQQTRVEQGMGYYFKFISTFPDIRKLANADEQQVIKLWEGLGYYSRARNLHKASKYIVDHCNAEFPNNYRALLSLKGVGPYTAAAIASIVFKEAVAAIDGNVLRVASRLFLITDPIDKAKTHNNIRAIMQDLIDVKNPGDFNQAMMELGAVVCTPKKPRCIKCPINEHCLAFANQKQNTIPVKSGKVKTKKLFFNFLVPDNNGKTIIIKRDIGIWIGLFQFPLIESNNRLLEQKEIENIIYEKGFKSITNLFSSPVIKHILTHRKISACFWTFNTDKLLDSENYIAINKSELVNYPLPKLLVNFINDTIDLELD